MTADIQSHHPAHIANRSDEDVESRAGCRSATSASHVAARRDATTTITTLILLLLCFVCTGTSAASLTPHNTSHGPMICNNGTEHRCVCGTEQPQDNSPIPCDHLIQARELPVVDMRARHVNLEALLHTNENYENYFKRRVAQIVSAYCERQVNECPGVALRLQKGDEDARIADAQAVLYSLDDSEPLLTQDNVVLLRVEREPGNVTRILFAIAKSDKLDSLSDADIIDPIKVKVILGSQAVPLSRILGGIKLESVRVSRIRRSLSFKETDNTRLKRIAIGVGLFLLVTYIIGAIKLYKGCMERKAKRKAEEGLAATTTVPNYGTLPTKGDDQKPGRNGSALAHRNHIEQEEPTYTQYQKIDETFSAVTSPPPLHREDMEDPPVLTDRQARFMFMCDTSQLPREPTFDSQTDLQASDSLKSTPPRDETIEEEPSVPALVVQSSMSTQAETPSPSIDSPETVIPKERLLSSSQSPPPGRPRSRRGSRVDEEQIDMTELGMMSHQPLFTDLVIPDDIEIEERPQSADRWSSSEGEVDVYYKLSDDDEVKGDNWGQPKATTQEEDSDIEEEPPKDNTDEAEAFVYERLREDASPMPPKQ